MKHKYICLIFAAISVNCTLFATSSFAQTPVLAQSDDSTITVNPEKSASITSEDTAKKEANSNEIAQSEGSESVKQPQPSLKSRIPIQSRVFTAPIMQQ
jgi:hypothetical protein